MRTLVKLNNGMETVASLVFLSQNEREQTVDGQWDFEAPQAEKFFKVVEVKSNREIGYGEIVNAGRTAILTEGAWEDFAPYVKSRIGSNLCLKLGDTEKQDRPIASWQPAFFDLSFGESMPIIPEMKQRYPVADALRAKLDRKHADAEALRHCYKKVMEIVDGPTPTPKAIMQLGYNLGRISEITGEGREIWDTTKGWVEQGLWTILYYWAEPRLAALEGGVKC